MSTLTPRICAAVSPAPTKKKPAIGSTEPIALKAKTKPSVMCSGQTSSILRGPSAASVASIISSAATPPTSAAASPPLSSGSPLPILGTTITATTPKKASGVTSAKHFDHFTRRSATMARLRSILESVASGSACSVPRAISALSKVPACSTCGSAPLARACQLVSKVPLAGTMCLRIDR